MTGLPHITQCAEPPISEQSASGAIQSAPLRSISFSIPKRCPPQAFARRQIVSIQHRRETPIPRDKCVSSPILHRPTAPRQGPL